MKKNEAYRINYIDNCLQKIKSENKVCPEIIDIHPVMNSCNLSCKWCIGGKIKTSPIFLTNEQTRFCMNKIFNINNKNWWPKEIHICGNNSEPLLNMNAIKEIIKYNKTNIYKLVIISNGLLINKLNVNDLCRVNTFNISLDAINNKDYLKKKCCRGEYTNPYSLICNNLYLLKNTIIKNQTDCVLSVSFVITDIDYINNNFINCIKHLKNCDVDIVKVRFETKGNYSKYNNLLRKKIEAINKIFNEVNIICNAAYSNKNDFFRCYSPFIWPTLAANMKLYPCAHCANEKFIALLDLNKRDYYDFYLNHNAKKQFNLNTLNCGKICSPIMNAINNKCLYKEHLL